MSGLALSRDHSNQRKSQTKNRNSRSISASSVEVVPPFWINSVLEGFTEGVLILTESGELVCANQKGGYWCQQLNFNNSPISKIPEAVWKLCQSVVEGRELFPHQHLIVESQVQTSTQQILYLQGRQFQLAFCDRPCLLVMIEEFPAASN